MSKLDKLLLRLGEILNAPRLGDFGDAIRRLVAEDKADEWKRDSEAAMERRARLNGPHEVKEEWRGLLI